MLRSLPRENNCQEDWDNGGHSKPLGEKCVEAHPDSERRYNVQERRASFAVRHFCTFSYLDSVFVDKI